MLARTFNFSRFITPDIHNTQTKVTLLITEARVIEASFSTNGTCFYGTQNGDSQKRLSIYIPLYFFFIEFCDIRRHNKTSQLYQTINSGENRPWLVLKHCLYLLLKEMLIIAKYSSCLYRASTVLLFHYSKLMDTIIKS